MKILFSPSEGKMTGGELPPLSLDTFSFPQCHKIRTDIMQRYMDFITRQDDTTLQKLIGVKKPEAIQILKEIDLFNDPTTKAIQRYNGVAYEYLDYASLPDDAQRFIDENVLIFSNLFGPIRAKDPIPYYKLKQGEKLGDFAIEKYYAKHCTSMLDQFLNNEFIIDLRAGFYLKFYKLTQPYITMKFIKNGKVVSHWAKAYRGMVVRELARYRPQNEQMFAEIPFKGLSILEIQKSRYKTEYIYEITA